MKKQNLLGLLLILVSGGVLVASANYGYFNPAAAVGEVFGETLVIALVLLPILMATPLRKKVEVLLAVGLVFFAISGWNIISNYQQRVEAREKVQQQAAVAEKWLSGEEITKPDVTNKNLSNVMQRYLAEIQRIHAGYLKDIEVSGFAESISPETLIDIAKARALKAKILALLERLTSYQQELLDEMSKFEQEMSQSFDPDMRAALSGFQKTKQQGIDQNTRYFTVQRDLLQGAINLMDLAISLDGALFIQNGQLMFPDQKSLDSYNNGLQELNRLLQSAQQLDAHNQALRDQRLQELEGLL